MFAKVLNSSEDLFASCCLNTCCNLNPSPITGLTGAAVVVVVVVGGPVVITGCADVPFGCGVVKWKNYIN